MGININQCADLLMATLGNYEKDRFQLTLTHTTAEALNKWFKKDKVVYDGGDRAEFYVQLDDSQNASHTRLYDTDNVNVAQVMRQGTVEWTHAKTSWAFDVREIAMNKGNKTRIWNLLKSRVAAAYKDLADLLEEAAWKTPTSATDDLNPHGIPGWLCQGDSDSTGDFTGYTPNYWTTSSSTYNAGGLTCSSSTNTRWANFYADHNGNLDDSLLKILRRAFRKTKFATPQIASMALDPESNFSNFRLYTTSAVLDELEEIATKSDDRLGADLGKYAGAVIFKGLPFIYIDMLDTLKTYVYGKNPIFGVNHNHFYPIVLSENNFRITKPTPKADAHNVLQGHVDVTYAYVCDNRRTGGFLISEYQGS